MRFSALASLTALLLAPACTTTTAATSNAPQPAAPAVVPPLSLSDLTADDQGLTSFTLRGTGQLGPGVQGSTLQWTAKDDQGRIGSGTAPVSVGADRTFSVAFPVVLGKNGNDLKPYQDLDDIEVTIDASVDGATTSKTVNLRSPHVPTSKILTVQGTLSDPNTIDLTFLYAIDNTNVYPLQLKTVDYKAYLSDKLVVDSQLPMAGKLKPSEQTEFSLPAQASPDNCGKDFREMARATSLPWRFTGVMHFESIDVPFDLNGTLDLTKTE